MIGSNRPSSTMLRLLLATSTLLIANGDSSPEWYAKPAAAAQQIFSGTYNSCHSIGVYCGRGSKCCNGLVCEPVASRVTGDFAPRCAVPDASTMDSNACYLQQHICYFHNQCCSGKCEDLDADHIFECTPNSTSSWNPINQAKEEEVVDWGQVDDTVPLLAIVLIVIGSVVMVAVIVGVVTRYVRKHQIEYQNLGVDEIPSSGWIDNTTGGKYLLGWHDELIHDYKPTESIDMTVLGGPPLPPRDYDEPQSTVPLHSNFDADESCQFTNVDQSTPVRPSVDYE